MSDVAQLLQELIRFDTTNPPGNEEACVAHIESLLLDAGIESERYEKTPGRPNLVARHAGTKDCPPLLLYGHVDVVTTAGQQWTQPPFAGELVDGVIYGRGALDMKGGVAMIVRAFLDGLPERCTLYGLRTMDGRVPTFAFNVEGLAPRAVSERLAEREIAVWDGNYYAVEIMQRLGLSAQGAVRAGFVHYNTEAEVDRLLEALEEL